MSKKIYLGDGAYAEASREAICITAENGIEATDTIYLGYAELKRLFELAKEMGLVT